MTSSPASISFDHSAFSSSVLSLVRTSVGGASSIIGSIDAFARISPQRSPRSIRYGAGFIGSTERR